MAIISGSKDVNRGGIYENVVAQELASARVALRYHRHSSRGEVDFIGETPDCEVVPMEVKSGKSYKRYVALNNLLSVEDHGVQTAYVLSEANVSVEDRMGKPVRYVPLYLMPFVARTLVSEDAGSGDELARMGLDARRLAIPHRIYPRLRRAWASVDCPSRTNNTTAVASGVSKVRRVAVLPLFVGRRRSIKGGESH